MKTLIFGSTALKYWIPELKRVPKDIDIIGKGVSFGIGNMNFAYFDIETSKELDVRKLIYGDRL